MASLNTKKVFVRGVTESGCKVYMPVDSDDPVLQHKAKKTLQRYLDSQPSRIVNQPEPPEPQVA